MCVQTLIFETKCEAYPQLGGTLGSDLRDQRITQSQMLLVRLVVLLVHSDPLDLVLVGVQ